MGLKEDIIDMKEEVKAVRNQSLAMELLTDYRKTNKRMFIIILVILAMWFSTICYLVYILNDIGVEETTTQEVSQENTTGNNSFIGKNGDIVYGEAKSKDNN